MNTSEPTAEQLRIALAIAREIGEAKDLKRLFDRKTAWVGADEVAIMFEIENYLRHWRSLH